MQIYKGMDIGTAKATKEEQSAVTHHCIDIVSPTEAFSTKAYRTVAMEAARDIVSRGKTPLFVGGTGLYLETLLRPEVTEEAPEASAEYHEAVLKTLNTEEDRIALWQRLEAVDPEAASAIHYNNTRRVIRALEIYDATGKTKTYFDMLTKAENTEISICHVTLDYHMRETLYARIDKRVDAMISEGLVEEARALINSGSLPPESTASQAIGYKEIAEVISCGAPLSSAIERIKQASRNYAKRQLTWFRHRENAIPLFCDTEEGDARSFSEIYGCCLETFENYLKYKNT